MLLDDYWKSDYDLWGAVSTPSAPQAETLATILPYDYWNPEGEDPAPPVTDGYDDYWKPEEKDLPPSYSDVYPDTRKQDGREPYPPATDNYDSYWRESDPTPSSPDTKGKTGTDDSDYWDATCMFDPSVFLGILGVCSLEAQLWMHLCASGLVSLTVEFGIIPIFWLTCEKEI